MALKLKQLGGAVKGQLLEAQEHKDPHEIMIKSKMLLLGRNTHTHSTIDTYSAL